MVKDRSKCDIVMTGLYQHFLWAKSPCSSLMLFDSFVILPNSHQKTGDINPRVWLLKSHQEEEEEPEEGQGWSPGMGGKPKR